jgi:hypothetical protein
MQVQRQKKQYRKRCFPPLQIMMSFSAQEGPKYTLPACNAFYVICTCRLDHK